MFFHGKSPVESMTHILENGGSALFLAIDENLPGNQMHWGQLIVATRETAMIKGKYDLYQNDVVALRTVQEYLKGEDAGVNWLPSPRGFYNTRPSNTWFQSRFRLVAPRESKERVLLAMRWVFNYLTRNATTFYTEDHLWFFAEGRFPKREIFLITTELLVFKDSFVPENQPLNKIEAEVLLVGITIKEHRKDWLNRYGCVLTELKVPLPISLTQTIEQEKTYGDK